MDCPAAPDPDSSSDPRPIAAADRAGEGRGIFSVSPAVAPASAGNPASWKGGAFLRNRAAPGIRNSGRGMGAGDPPLPGRKVPAEVARRALPGRGGDLGATDPFG